VTSFIFRKYKVHTGGYEPGMILLVLQSCLRGCGKQSQPNYSLLSEIYCKLFSMVTRIAFILGLFVAPQVLAWTLPQDTFGGGGVSQEPSPCMIQDQQGKWIDCSKWDSPKGPSPSGAKAGKRQVRPSSKSHKLKETPLEIREINTKESPNLRDSDYVKELSEVSTVRPIDDTGIQKEDLLFFERLQAQFDGLNMKRSELQKEPIQTIATKRQIDEMSKRIAEKEEILSAMEIIGLRMRFDCALRRKVTAQIPTLSIPYDLETRADHASIIIHRTVKDPEECQRVELLDEKLYQKVRRHRELTRLLASNPNLYRGKKSRAQKEQRREKEEIESEIWSPQPYWVTSQIGPQRPRRLQAVPTLNQRP
jgi:hypothetical protein